MESKVRQQEEDSMGRKCWAKDSVNRISTRLWSLAQPEPEHLKVGSGINPLAIP